MYLIFGCHMLPFRLPHSLLSWSSYLFPYVFYPCLLVFKHGDSFLIHILCWYYKVKIHVSCKCDFEVICSRLLLVYVGATLGQVLLEIHPKLLLSIIAWSGRLMSRVIFNNESTIKSKVKWWYSLISFSQPIGHLYGYPTMHHSGIPRHTQSMLAYLWFWLSISENSSDNLHCGNVVNMPYFMLYWKLSTYRCSQIFPVLFYCRVDIDLLLEPSEHSIGSFSIT